MKLALASITGVALLLGGVLGCSRSDPSATQVADTSSELAGPNEAHLAEMLDFPEDESERKLAIERGHHSFYTYGCWHCHAIGSEEPPGMRNEFAMGPDMGDVGNRLSAKEILRSILHPSAVIAEPREIHMANHVSKMPAFQDPLAKDDIRDMVLFLHQSTLPAAPETQIVKVTDENYKHTVETAEELVLLDFWAEWCFACLELNPVLEEIASEYQGRMTFGKVEVDENPVLVGKFVPDLMFPCLVIMKDGKVIDRKYGVNPELEPRDFLKDWFSRFLSTPRE
jgi:thioredoxin 1